LVIIHGQFCEWLSISFTEFKRQKSTETVLLVRDDRSLNYTTSLDELLNGDIFEVLKKNPVSSTCTLLNKEKNSLIHCSFYIWAFFRSR